VFLTSREGNQGAEMPHKIYPFIKPVRHFTPLVHANPSEWDHRTLILVISVNCDVKEGNKRDV
jgi:hypothetical protein